MGETFRRYSTQEFLGLLPSWRIVRLARTAHIRRILNQCGDGLDLGREVLFDFPERISIGSNVRINFGTIITARAPISIGNDVLIAPYVIINSGNHGVADRDVPIRLQSHVSAPIIIADNVWIGAHSIILPGVSIGKGAVVAAGAVVTKNVCEDVIVAGVPAKIIRKRGQRAG